MAPPSRERATEAFEEALLEDDPVLLYERAPVGYLSTSATGRIVKANQTLSTWTGYSHDELLARSFVDLLSAGGRIYHETHYSPMLRMQGTVREIALDLVRRDGSRLPVLVNARLDRTAHDHPVVRIVVFDATERRQYERELLDAKDRAEASDRRARALATTLQQTLIPPMLPRIDGLEIGAAYRPAGDGSEVGGDFYDVFQVGPDTWMLAVGDVCGKGVEAAVVTALARYTIRALAVSHPGSLTELVDQLNEVVLQEGTGRFLTLILARLDRVDNGWDVELTTGGHPPPVLSRHVGRVVATPVSGDLIGVVDAPDIGTHRVHLGPGDGLLLYTDGVTEARRDQDFFGEERLLDVAGGAASAAEQVGRVLNAVLEYQRGTAADDVALVAVRCPVDP
ncbi:PP2C family protein-serine/threonine phosphatase [Nocardioides sp. GCM10027113]|uniref:PP2C family protein-serine/threonine phosphatase n=1 Tax=unclassified Nocardioides TaxID=2615069 RepID=UPI00360B7054